VCGLWGWGLRLASHPHWWDERISMLLSTSCCLLRYGSGMHVICCLPTVREHAHVLPENGSNAMDKPSSGDVATLSVLFGRVS
jgi:hypothetical protein